MTQRTTRGSRTRGIRHQYIDRIVVSPLAKGTGIGRALYESVFERARERGASEITAEVNLRPGYPGSVAFHEKLGFRQLEEQETRGGTVRVCSWAAPSTRPTLRRPRPVPRPQRRAGRSGLDAQTSMATIATDEENDRRKHERLGHAVEKASWRGSGSSRLEDSPCGAEPTSPRLAEMRPTMSVAMAAEPRTAPTWRVVL